MSTRSAVHRTLHGSWPALGFLLFAGIAFSIPLVIGTDAKHIETLTLWSFGVTALFAVAALIGESLSRPFSLNNAHWVAILFLLVYAPFSQYYFGSPPKQTDLGFFAETALKANSLVLLWCACFAVSYRFMWKASTVTALTPIRPIAPASNFWLLVISACSVILVAGTLGVGGMFSRANGAEGALAAGQSTTLIVLTFGKAIPVICLAWRALSMTLRNNASTWLTFTCLLSLALLSNFPPSQARYWTAMLLIGAVCMFLRDRIRYGFWFGVAVFSALFFLLPILGLFRHKTVAQVDFGAYKQDDFRTLITGGDYDAYSMLVNTIHQVDSGDGPFPARQMIGNLLFFLPRSVWPEKPMGSGYEVGKKGHLHFLNLSEPIVAEGYLNGGIVGVIIFAVVLGGIVRIIDDAFWFARMRAGPFRDACALAYPFLLGFMFFMVRGDFLSSFAYTTGFSTAALLISWLSFRLRFGPAARYRRVVGARVLSIANDSFGGTEPD